MNPTIGGPRPLAPPEPAPPLRALLDVPLRFAIAAPLAAELQGLSQTVRQTPPDGAWADVYARAIEIGEALARDADARIEDMQRKALSADDPNETRQRLSQGPRRDAERARADAKGALQKALREWIDRSKRQFEHVSTQCLETAGKTMQLDESPTHAGIALAIDKPWAAQFAGYVGRCCEEWTRNVTTGADGALATAASGATAAAVEKLRAAAVRAPATAAAPSTDARVGSDLPSKEVDVPSTGAALLHYVRSNVMAVGIFGTVLAVAVALAGKLSGEGESHGSPNTMLLRGGLILAVLPFSVVFGLKAARRQRAALRDKAIAAQRQAVQGYLKSEVEKALERHRKALERWMTARSDEWATAVDRWWEEAIEPKLADADAAGVEAMRELKLQQAKMTEEQTALRTFRSQLTQSLLFDLRKRQRELVEAAARAGGS
jgi:hypothetical protein